MHGEYNPSHLSKRYEKNAVSSYFKKRTKADNRYIDEAIPKETMAHAFDYIWWFTYFRNRDGDKK